MTTTTPVALPRMSCGTGSQQKEQGRQSLYSASLSFQWGLTAISILNLLGSPAVNFSKLLSSTLNWLLFKGLKKTPYHMLSKSLHHI